jgi:hypothetical protein
MPELLLNASGIGSARPPETILIMSVGRDFHEPLHPNFR